MVKMSLFDLSIEQNGFSLYKWAKNSNSKIQMMIVVETFQVVVTFRGICKISEYLRQHGFHLLTIAAGARFTC